MSAAPKQTPARASRKRFFILPVQSFTEELGERISAARRCCKLTQEELAQKSRTSLSTYKRIERGDTTVSIGTILSVLHVLDNLESCEDILADVLQASHGNRLPQRVRHKKVTASQEAASLAPKPKACAARRIPPLKKPPRRKKRLVQSKADGLTAKSPVRSRTASDAQA